MKRGPKIKNKQGGICIICKSNVVTSKGTNKYGKKYYRNKCWSCRKKEWSVFKKDHCENCGFIPIHRCQLDVDHIDGNNKNNNPDNFRTLCANCHRLKTRLHKDNFNKY